MTAQTEQHTGVQSDPGETYVRLLDAHVRRLWLLAAVLYLCGDILTTLVGIKQTPLREVGPLPRYLIDQFGADWLVGVKLLTFGGFLALWYSLPRPVSVGVPLGLVVAGGGATLWNTVLLVLVFV
jgi:hypothetical protein